MNEKEKPTCPICGAVAQVWWWREHDGSEVECEVCGRYRISHLLMTGWKKGRESGGFDDSLLRYLSAYTRQTAEPPTILHDIWEDLAKQHRETPFPVKGSNF